MEFRSFLTEPRPERRKSAGVSSATTLGTLPTSTGCGPVLRFLLKRLLIRAKHRWMSFSSVLNLCNKGRAISFQLFSSIHPCTAQPPGWAKTSSGGLYQHTALALLFYLAVPHRLPVSAEKCDSSCQFVDKLRCRRTFDWPMTTLQRQTH